MCASLQQLLYQPLHRGRGRIVSSGCVSMPITCCIICALREMFKSNRLVQCQRKNCTRTLGIMIRSCMQPVRELESPTC